MYKKELKQNPKSVRKQDIKAWEDMIKALENSKYKIAFNRWNRMDTEPSEGVWRIDSPIATLMDNALYDFVNPGVYK